MYLNAAVRLVTPLSPEILLDELLAIERRHGRERRERWGPRRLDLDILWIAGQRVDTQRLRVPHPELTHRAFALLPLLDVAPDATDPAGNEPYAAQLSRMATSGARRIAGTAQGAWCR